MSCHGCGSLSCMSCNPETAMRRHRFAASVTTAALDVRRAAVAETCAALRAACADHPTLVAINRVERELLNGKG